MAGNQTSQSISGASSCRSRSWRRCRVERPSVASDIHLSSRRWPENEWLCDTTVHTTVLMNRLWSSRPYTLF